MMDIQSNQSVTVVIKDNAGWQLLRTDEDVATTLIATASDDPIDWPEMIACWPRYVNCTVPEFISNLPIEPVEFDEAMQAVLHSDAWVALDLTQKRFLSGGDFQPIERDACFAMYTDDDGQQHDPLSVHLPPWWELLEQTDPKSIGQARSTAMARPFVDRRFLFGEPLLTYLAERVLEVASTETGRQTIAAGKPNRADDLHRLTVEIHRDWLMTPRDEIGGRIPRDLLHGGMGWIDQLSWSQRLRFEQGGHAIVALPLDVTGYANGPMGIEEVALYFDLCRELLGAAWTWCDERIAVNDAGKAERGMNSQPIKTGNDRLAGSPISADLAELTRYLHEVKTRWMNEPFEGGSPPSFVIECSRRRVPRGAGVEIVGMSQRQVEEHVIDCDCPICLMMADGMMGVGFVGIDGHHLELDGEFAFSTRENREAWEEQQREWAEMDARFEAEAAERARKIAAGEIESDDLESTWSGGFTSDAMPGGQSGDLQLAFLLAELISELEQYCEQQRSEYQESINDPEIIDHRKLIKQLNTEFSAFRNSTSDELSAAANALSETLESITTSHPDLTPRLADFQSRIQDRLRHPVTHDEGWDDLPS